MLDFEEELKKFQKSTEIEDLEDAIASNDLTDMNDLMFKMYKDMEDFNAAKAYNDSIIRPKKIP